LGKGYDIQIFDRNVELARLTGTNRDFLLNAIPHISNLLVDDIQSVIQHGDIIVVGNASPEFPDALSDIDDSKHLIDLVRMPEALASQGNYDGIAW